MKTEKDIRDFMRGHRMEVPDGDRFMDDIVRQIDLLPTPASFEKIDARKQQEELDAVKCMFKSVKRFYMKRAFLITVLVVAISSVLAAIVFLFPDTFLALAEHSVDAFSIKSETASGFGAIAKNIFAFLPSAATLASTFFYFLIALFAVVFITMSGRKSLG